METVLICGGSGLIGKFLSQKLIAKGYQVIYLGRKKNDTPDDSHYYWDIEKQEIEVEAVQKAQYIINLTGENIGSKRWSTKQKSLIRSTRLNSTKLIFETIKNQNIKIKAFISASAIGYYGSVSKDKIFTENDDAADDFLGILCKQWEDEVDKFDNLGIRNVKIRTAMVLSKEAGALPKMSLPIRFGLGSPIGNGEQIVPWIHIYDLCNIYINAIENKNISGSYNAVAPQYINNKLLTKNIAKILNKPLLLPSIPRFLIKWIFGEMSCILLEGSRISSDKIIQTGFQFEYTEIDKALKNLLL